jgi:TRAP-type C4-dicarboxylate transport system permease small subunit
MGKKKMELLHDRLKRLVRFIDQAELVIVVGSLLLIVVINSMEIFSRFALNKSFFWVYEITILAANVMYFLGASLVYKRKQDVQMEYFLKFFSLPTQRKWDFVIDAACFYFFIILLYHGIRLLGIQSRHVSQGLGIPNHYFSLPLVVGTLSMILIMAQQMIERLLKTGERR